MDFKDILFVSDYDSTMTGEMHLVPQENLEALHEFTSQGGAFTIASGRGKREWRSSFEEVPFNAPLILSNGAVIYDTATDRELYHGLLSEKQKELAGQLFLSLPEGCGGLIEANEIVYIPDEIYETTNFKGFPGSNAQHPPLKEIPAQWDKISFVASRTGTIIPGENPFDFSKISTDGVDELEKRAEAMGLSGIRSLPIMYEIPPEGTDKGSCARRLLHLLGRKVLVCAGDAPNDLAMLKEADYCFIPHESILEQDGLLPEGAIMTVRCEEAAIADVIRQLKDL